MLALFLSIVEMLPFITGQKYPALICDGGLGSKGCSLSNNLLIKNHSSLQVLLKQGLNSTFPDVFVALLPTCGGEISFFTDV